MENVLLIMLASNERLECSNLLIIKFLYIHPTLIDEKCGI